MSKKYRVFWVDDDRFFAKPYLDRLQRNGFDVLFQNTAEGAIRAVVENVSLDAVVLDVMMHPPLGAPSNKVRGGFSTGLWILGKIGKEAKARRMPIVVLTNKGLADVTKEIGDRWPSELLKVRTKDQVGPADLCRILKEMIARSKSSKLDSGDG